MSRLAIILAATGLLLGTSLHSTHASADILPPGYKGAKASIQVSAELPKDHVLVLANTFNGATPLEPGKPSDVSWHPLAGELELVLVKRADLKQLENLPREQEPRWKTIRQYSTSCSKAFRGVRSIKASEPYDEVRWYYEAEVNGDKCTSKLVRTAHLAKGEEVPAPAVPPSADVPSAVTSALPQGTDTPSPPNKPAASGGCSGCATSRSAPASGWLLAPLLLLWRRRR
ncbi:MAG: hypothetical protein R3B07_10795 [Polyangiaceae bacterium]